MNAIAIGTKMYCACVDFELRAGRLLGLTYRDLNAGLFFVLFPFVTFALVLLVVHQRRVLARFERGKKGSG